MFSTTTCFQRFKEGVRVALLAAVMSMGASGTIGAQPTASDPNPGSLTFTGAFDVPSLYLFRGIRQETDPAITLWPAGDIGLSLFSSDGGIKSGGVNFGVWNSLHTGSSGTDGQSGRLHYEEDFYASLSLGFGGGVTVTPGFMALTSPNAMFNTVKEFQLKVAKTHWLSPYGFLAMELSDNGQADAGANKGTYLELGVAPSFPLAGGNISLGIPVKLGLSLKDYYEHPLTGEDSKLGFFDVGGLITVPLGIPARFGSWNVHGGADVLFFGDTTEYFNLNSDGERNSNKVVALFGVGVTY